VYGTGACPAKDNPAQMCLLLQEFGPEGVVKIAIFVATVLGLLIANAIAIVYRIKSVVIVEGSNIEIDEMDSLRGYYFQQAICRSGIQSLKYNLGDLE
jgi:hypothetical protein